MDFCKSVKKLSVREKIGALKKRQRAGEFVYLDGILHALAPFVDKVTIDAHTKYYVQTAIADGTKISGYSIKAAHLLELLARRDKLQGKTIHCVTPSGNSFDLDATLRSINENLNNAAAARKEIYSTKEGIGGELETTESQKLIKNVKEFEKGLTTAENLIGMLEKHRVKVIKKEEDGHAVSGAEAASAASTNYEGTSDHSLTQTDMQSSFPAGSSSSSSSSSTPSSSASSFGRELTDKEKRRYDQAIEQHIYGKKREPKSGADFEKLTKEVNLFKAVAEDNHTKQNVRYEEMLTLVRRMGGDVFPFGKKGGSHRRIEIPHVNNGKIITCGTYEPHGGEGYPLWLDFSMNAITRAMV
ncbi:hypothetical protein [Candidatus Finniella inopinata]|uniref:Uncharacterized protein n=1 Tax=Candidatus Finniella inopinata TaxID=1696036 RepID=A0A4Q7DIJ8_9PROT|nr:hypothetical protein [Candidatus Finniella inopinata]RZI45925.1 hypothetical protein EQU50_05700 [Candidatus Finniella inopinata]